MTRFQASVQKRDATTGRAACEFFVETVTCDDAAAEAVRRSVRWAQGTEPELTADESSWIFLGRDWFTTAPEGLDSEFKARLRAWLVHRAGMADDDTLLVNTWTVGFAELG